MQKHKIHCGLFNADTFFRSSGTNQGGTFYVAVDTTNKHIVVAFRGMDERASNDLIRAADAGSSESVPFTQLCAGCNGNPILLTDYMFNNATIINEVNRLVNLPAYNDYTIVVAGHSWGGALASIAVIALRNAFPNKIVDVVRLVSSQLSNVFGLAILGADLLLP
jgi:hypothetical protein